MTIKVYSTPTCPWCEKTKEYLTEKNVKFENIDVSKDEKARNDMFEKSGQFGVPVIEAGESIIIGFDKEKIDAAISSSQSAANDDDFEQKEAA